MRPDICHRESEFSDLSCRIQQKLLTAFVPGAEADYVAVVMTGSGTAAVESAVMSCLPTGKRMLVLNNGVYGERISNMIGLHRLGVSELKSIGTVKPDPERVRLALTPASGGACGGDGAPRNDHRLDQSCQGDRRCRR